MTMETIVGPDGPGAGLTPGDARLMARRLRELEEHTRTLRQEATELRRELSVASRPVARLPPNPVPAAPKVPLTRREREVVCLVALDLTSRQIADRLFVSKRTIDFHLANVFDKLQVQSRVGAAMWAVSVGLVTFKAPAASPAAPERAG